MGLEETRSVDSVLSFDPANTLALAEGDGFGIDDALLIIGEPDLGRLTALAHYLKVTLDRFRRGTTFKSLSNDHAIYLASTLANAIYLDRVLDRSLTGTISRICDLDPDRARARDNSSINSLYSSPDLNQAIIVSLALAKDLSSILSSSRTFMAVLVKIGAREEHFHQFRRSLRYLSYVLASIFRRILLLERSTHTPKQRQPQNDGLIEELSDEYLRMYVLLTLQEERAQGNVPAWEGILLVKERRKNI